MALSGLLWRRQWRDCPQEVAFFNAQNWRNSEMFFSLFGQHLPLEVFKWLVGTCYWGKAGLPWPLKKCHFTAPLKISYHKQSFQWLNHSVWPRCFPCEKITLLAENCTSLRPSKAEFCHVVFSSLSISKIYVTIKDLGKSPQKGHWVHLRPGEVLQCAVSLAPVWLAQPMRSLDSAAGVGEWGVLSEMHEGPRSHKILIFVSKKNS